MSSSRIGTYSAQQNTRVSSEWARTLNQLPDEGGHAEGPRGAALPGFTPHIVEVPPAEKCIGQVVLDWEFIHDLDLHLLRVVDTSTPPRTKAAVGGWRARRTSAEPSPEPGPEPSPEPQPAPAPSELALPSFELSSLVDPQTRELRLKGGQRLETIVYYGSKVHPAGGTGRDVGAPPQAVLQLDRNAEIHSLKPVENLYLTETLEAGVYVVGVHNYSQRQLLDDLVGPSGQFPSFEDFKKKCSGYCLMEKALKEQNDHAGDEDGTPEKRKLMKRVDQEMEQGFSQMSGLCYPGDGHSGVHYGVTIYTYPDSVALASAGRSEAVRVHPQQSSLEDLQELFKPEFFATAECVFDPDANPTGYNGANVLADVRSEEGRLALSNGRGAHLALLKVVSGEEAGGRARLAEVRLLASVPRPQGLEMDSEQAALAGPAAMRALRRGQMRGSRGAGDARGRAAATAVEQPEQQPEPEAASSQNDSAASAAQGSQSPSSGCVSM